ncbi:PCNA-associated factor isoform X2 [Bombus vancouverensis nearcticus]|uniref:PCNA-associated factor isoform X2 n=1 Tax=Bombus vancouverensis nearcticus TaxID=2705178 RepID=UPI001438719E|nr:PCNA-associated factor-like [Bombus vancouverensis nearcticus]
MVRTKADRVPTRAVGSKAPHKTTKSTPVKKSGSSSKGKSYSGGNPYHPRETPEWQKPITCFLNQGSVNQSENLSKAQGAADGGPSQVVKNESD